MADNLQIKTEKLIKYGNEKFGLSETTLRGVLDNASGSENLNTELDAQDVLLTNLETEINGLPEASGGDSTTGEWQPNPTWWDIEKILAEDTREYSGKAIVLLRDSEDSIEFSNNSVSFATAFATSDGAFYEFPAGSQPSVTHTWDTTQDKPCIVDNTEVYKTRYYIFYCSVTNLGYVQNISQKKDIIGFISNDKCAPAASGTNSACGFMNCYNLEMVSVGYPQLSIKYFQACMQLRKCYIDTQKATNFTQMFSGCYGLVKIPTLNTSKGTNFNQMFSGCYGLVKIPTLDTSKGTDFTMMFNGCYALSTIPEIDLISATSNSYIFDNCYLLRNLTVKNVKNSLQIGSGTKFGHLLTLESLLNTMKELWDNSSGTSTLTLTVGSENLTKLTNVYVKLIDITEEMRADDKFIDNKKPFEVCESTDEGAMTVAEYVTSKNWQLA